MISCQPTEPTTVSTCSCVTHSKDKGLIVIGYQGIGKSTIASGRNDIIDLESSNFMIDGERDDEWFVIYCRMAVAFARQKYTVLISSHHCVVEELNKYDLDNDYDVVIVCPHYSLKDLWINKLRQRLIDVPNDKNQRALENAEKHFESSIDQLAGCPYFSHIFLRSMDYSLGNIILLFKTIESTNTNKMAPVTVGCI